MPIRADLRQFYGHEWRKVTRPRILERAGNRCEACAVPNYAQVERRGAGTWLDVPRPSFGFGAAGITKLWRDRNGRVIPKSEVEGPRRKVQIMLTVGHVNHIAGDDRDENLRAWCQWCHLAHDREHHYETRAARKDAGRPIIVASQQPEV